MTRNGIEKYVSVAFPMVACTI